MTVEPFFREAGGRFEPQEPARGFWARGQLNGVAVGGLLAQLCDTHAASAQMRACRITIDILRGVPFQPLEASCRVIRGGRNVQMLEAQILAGGELFARAAALRVRRGESPELGPAEIEWPAPEESGDTPVNRGQAAGSPIESRRLRSARDDGGKGVYWTRANAALVEGHATTPLARAVMAADIASGAASPLDWRAWSFANLDLTVSLARDPVDDWVLAEAGVLSAGDGAGVLDAKLADRRGPIGTASQVLYFTPRPPRA